MYDLNKEVFDEMLVRKSNKEMFTVYDIRRILLCRIGGTIYHDDVRVAVESQYKQAGFHRDIGYHLPYSPPPQIYYQKGQDINKYDPEALDPIRSTTIPTAGFVSMCGNCMPAISSFSQPKPKVQTEYFYARVNKKTGERSKPYSSYNHSGLYRTKNGPVQLGGNDKDHEVVKYKVTLERVN